MSVATRKRIYLPLALFSGLAFIVYGASVARTLVMPPLAGDGGYSGFGATTSLFFFEMPTAPAVVAAVGVSGLACAIALATIAKKFRKTVSVEIFFFAFWMAACSVESLRALIFMLAHESAPVLLIEGLSRGVLFARAFGVLSLFMASLYPAGYRNEKLGVVAFVVGLVALGVATGMPLNSGMYSPQLTAEIGYGQFMTLMVVLATIATAVNFVIAGMSRNETAFLDGALSVSMASIGNFLLVAAVNPLWLLAGLALFLAGIVTFLRRMHKYYLWQ